MSMKALVSVGFLSCLALGCSSDGGPGGGNPSDDPTGCGASGKLSGGVEHVMGDRLACSGTDSSAAVMSFLGSGSDLFAGGSIGFTVDFVTAPALGVTGPASIERVTVRETSPEPEDDTQPAERFEWEFSGDACTLDIMSTVRDPDFSWLWFYAEGSCSGAAQPVAPNTKAPVSLAAFSMNAFVSLAE